MVCHQRHLGTGIMSLGGAYVVRGGVAQRRGRAGIVRFTIGVDTPTKLNVGSGLQGVSLTSYSGPGAGSNLQITTANAVYSHLDFGNTSITIKTSGVTFNDCKFTANQFALSNGSGFVDCVSTSAVNASFTDCTFNNLNQSSWNVPAFEGHDTTFTRCVITGFIDAADVVVNPANAGGNLNVSFQGCYLGELAWFYNATSGIVHGGDTVTHNDTIQMMGGVGLTLYGTTLDGYYSTVVGTGTPGSGGDNTGNPTGQTEPTYAAGVTARNTLIEAFGVDAAHRTGGTLSALMVNSGNSSPTPNMNITYSWLNGGGVTVNANDTGLKTNLGILDHITFDLGARFTSGGRPLCFETKTNGSDSLPLAATFTNNVWIDGSTPLPARFNNP